MNVLISFCNTLETPGYPNLGLINLETQEFLVPELPGEIAQTGMLGLALTDKYLLVGQQHTEGGQDGYSSPPALLIFDRRNLTLLKSHPLQLVRDIHSFLWLQEESKLLIVSSGTDEVIEVMLQDTEILSESLFWKPKGITTRMDTLHLNSIFRHEGEIYVSGFGQKEIEDDWSSAHNGFIYNITTDKEIISGLEQPHSIDVIDGEMAICESRIRKFRVLNDAKSIELPGYVRGLCHTPDFILVGTSASRKKSKSTGKHVAEPLDQIAGCTISQVSWPSLAVVHVWDLNDYGIEIYELLLIENVSNWPLELPRNFRQEYHESWVYRVQYMLDEITEAIPADTTLLIADPDLIQIKNELLFGYKTFPFLEKDGIYWGPPGNDETAIRELKRMCKLGAEYLVLPWTAFWWVDHYAGFHSFLLENTDTLHASDKVFIFRLHAEELMID